ncbi:hypothetical protein E1K64_20235 [Salmonella enterica subsp. enterica serovar Poona]|nr:hypothetical protein [Salmonella enterica subsp. enterica serovar Poona]HEB6949284.1 BamA/TamA family outer membrane protein [Salmonella enterica subsp. enterica serovar Hvittingfoss]
MWRPPVILPVILTLSVMPSCHARLLPSREQVDAWLAPLGADDHFDTGKTIDWGLLPGPFYTPELGPGLGMALAGMYRPTAGDTVSQNSTLSLSGYVSATGATGIHVSNYAFFAQDRWRFFLDGSVSHTPTYYWGQGFTAAEHDSRKQKYTSQGLKLRPVVYRQVSAHTWLGVGWSLDMQHAAGTGSNNRLIENTPQGVSVLSSGVSLDLTRDTRDFAPNPRTGQLADMHYTHYTPGTGSDTRFEEYTLHYSHYRPLSEKSVLAWELYGDFTQGVVPWSSLPLLGDSHRMRGYYEGRYRDRNAVSGQMEYRHRLGWRHGVVGWVGAGTMAPSFHQLGRSRWLPSVGVGYRFEFKPRMNVRLDYGAGRGSSGFYFQVGEAF